MLGHRFQAGTAAGGASLMIANTSAIAITPVTRRSPISITR
jgi:hypothetical protein